MRRFQNLIRHKERWASDIPLTCPIEELIPPDIQMPERMGYLNREILKAMNVVWRGVNFAGVPTGVTRKRWDGIEQKDVERHYDVILDYFRLPRDTRPHDAYEAVMSVLEQAIGVYESRLKQAKWDFVNPVVWLAHLVRLPITVMERAGLMSHDKSAEIVLGGYGKFMKVAMSAILVLIALRLGVKLPWKEVFAKLVELFAK